MSELHELLYSDFKPDPKQVGARIREIRKKLGYSMDEFGKKIDDKAKSGTISNWETGKNLPNNKRLKIIADLGGVSLLYLLKGEKSLADVTEEELSEIVFNFKNNVYQNDYSKTRNSELQKKLQEIFSVDLSDLQLDLLNNSLKLILNFKKEDDILSLFNAIIEDSNIVFSSQLNGDGELNKNYLQSSVELSENIKVLADRIKL